METTIVGYILGLYGDNGKMETTMIGCILGLYRNNGKDNGNYYSRVYIEVIRTGLMAL